MSRMVLHSLIPRPLPTEKCTLWVGVAWGRGADRSSDPQQQLATCSSTCISVASSMKINPPESALVMLPALVALQPAIVCDLVLQRASAVYSKILVHAVLLGHCSCGKPVCGWTLRYRRNISFNSFWVEQQFAVLVDNWHWETYGQRYHVWVDINCYLNAQLWLPVHDNLLETTYSSELITLSLGARTKFLSCSWTETWKQAEMWTISLHKMPRSERLLESLK